MTLGLSFGKLGCPFSALAKDRPFPSQPTDLQSVDSQSTIVVFVGIICFSGAKSVGRFPLLSQVGRAEWPSVSRGISYTLCQLSRVRKVGCPDSSIPISAVQASSSR